MKNKINEFSKAGYNAIYLGNNIFSLTCLTCGGTFERTYGHFSSGAISCKLCSDKQLMETISSTNPSFTLGTMFTENKIRYITLFCNNGHAIIREVHNIKKQRTFCVECSNNAITEKFPTFTILDIGSGVLSLTCKTCNTTIVRSRNNLLKYNTICNICDIEHKKNNLIKIGFKYVSGDFSASKNYIETVCVNGHKNLKTYEKYILNPSCSECAKQEKIQYLNSIGYDVLSENLREELVVRCFKGHIFSRSFGNFKQNKHKCPICFPYTTTEEVQLKTFLEENKYIVESSLWNLIPPYEIDLFIEEIRTGIEYNGSYWHSQEIGKHKEYHLTKTKLAHKNGIHIIHIFEHEWKQENREQTKSLILQILNTIKTKEIFLENNMCDVSKWGYVPLSLGYDIESQTEPTLVKQEKYSVYDCGVINWSLHATT